ncbi:MAG: DUF4249 domain-containing protein [Lewinella sp.]|nr:DUF4249 domain-containing protein [Lewinella sp.]
MKKNSYIFLLLICLISMLSCKDFSQIVEIEFPEHESKLVTTAVMGDVDAYLRILVSNSIGIQEDRSSFAISDARVQIFKDGQLFLTVPYDSTSAHYTALLEDSIRSYGTLFRLEVSAADYPLLSAEQIMPRPVPVSYAEIELEGTVDMEGHRVDEVIVEFQDPSGEENYYGLALEGEQLFVIDGDTLMGNVQQYLNTNDPTLTQVYNAPYSLVFSDASFNGRKIRISTYTSGNSLRTFQGRVILYHLTRDLYLYNRSVVLYENAVDNPFVEPVTVHNNIDNGYGLFGLYAISAYKLN